MPHHQPVRPRAPSTTGRWSSRAARRTSPSADSSRRSGGSRLHHGVLRVRRHARLGSARPRSRDPRPPPPSRPEDRHRRTQGRSSQPLSEPCRSASGAAIPRRCSSSGSAPERGTERQRKGAPAHVPPCCRTRDWVYPLPSLVTRSEKPGSASLRRVRRTPRPGPVPRRARDRTDGPSLREVRPYSR